MGAGFGRVRETGLVLRDALVELGMRPLVKTSGSSGLHLYITIARGPTQREVWRYAKRFANQLERRHPRLITTEFRVADRPRGRVLVDYNQNAWGRTLASDFRLDNVPARVRRRGDLWKPLLSSRGRFPLAEVL